MEQKEIEEIKEGTILNTSFGYDMTINHFCVVVQKGKTLLCQLIGKKSLSSDDSSVIPDITNKFNSPFRLRVYLRDRYSLLSGGYPAYEDGILFRKGANWRIWNGKPVYENHED